MMTFLAVTLLLAHGMVHPAIYAAPVRGTPAAPFDPSRSWALASFGVDTSDTRRVSIALSWLVAAAFYVVGVGVAVDASWWPAAAASAATAGLVLKLLWFNSWLTLGVLIDCVILAVAISA